MIWSFTFNAISTHINVSINFKLCLEVAEGQTHCIGNQTHSIVRFSLSHDNLTVCVCLLNRFWIFALNPCRDSKESIEVSLWTVTTDKFVAKFMLWCYCAIPKLASFLCIFVVVVVVVVFFGGGGGGRGGENIYLISRNKTYLTSESLN